VAALNATAELERIVVVLGAHARDVLGAVEFGRAEPVVCDGWREGIAASLRCAVQALGRPDLLVIGLGDQPGLTPASVEAVLAVMHADPGLPAARATYAGAPGHPVVLRSTLLDAVMGLRGDAGAGRLLGDAAEVDCSGLGAGDDVDTAEQLAAVADRMGQTGASTDPAAGAERPGSSRTGRIRELFSRSRMLMKIAWRDPDHVPERLTLLAVSRLGAPSMEWAARALAAPGADPAALAESVRLQSAKVARIDGSVAGTPFLVALVPGYLGYLWQEAAMVLRIAALCGRDARTDEVAAELLALRGLHPSVQDARRALADVAATPLPGSPDRRRSVRTWLASARMVLVFGGFLSSPFDVRRHGRAYSVAMLAVGAGVWVVTMIFPVTFMLAMAYSCETDTRRLGRRAQLFFGGTEPSPRLAIDRARRRRRPRRELLRSALVLVSVAVPIAFVVVADRVRAHTHVSAIGAVGALVALSLVIATTVVARSR
jgi:CTP:molybdopterin cytidylyltransferase MocA